MAADMKEIIAEGAYRLMAGKRVRKLTVKDIVEECGITRQTFYYHFEDIPDLFRWILEKGSRRLLAESMQQNDPEERLRYLFLAALNAQPYVERGLRSGYREELERIIRETFYSLFEKAAESGSLYEKCSRRDAELILRYHCGAVIELLRNWTEEDTRELDYIVHGVHLLLSGQMPSFSEKKEVQAAP